MERDIGKEQKSKRGEREEKERERERRKRERERGERERVSKVESLETRLKIQVRRDAISKPFTK